MTEEKIKSRVSLNLESKFLDLDALKKNKIFDSKILYENYNKWEQKSSKNLRQTGRFQEKIDKISRVKIRTGHVRYRSQVDLSKTSQVSTNKNFKMNIEFHPKHKYDNLRQQRQ